MAVLSSITELKSKLNQFIKTNLQQLITGVILNGFLHDAIDTLNNLITILGTTKLNKSDIGFSSTGINLPTGMVYKINGVDIISLVINGGGPAGPFNATPGIVPAAGQGTGVGGVIVNGNFWRIIVSGSIPGLLPRADLEVGDILVAAKNGATLVSDFYSIPGDQELAQILTRITAIETKLITIENDATADQTGDEIRDALSTLSAADRLDSSAIKNIVDAPYDNSSFPDIDTVKKALDNSNNKVDKIAGKGLSTNDYTNEEKTKLAALNNLFLGSYISYTALVAAQPTAKVGSEANVDPGIGQQSIRYIWDAQDGWVSGGPGTVNSVNGQAGAVVLTPDNIGAEASLGKPLNNGYVLSSLATGERSWVPMAEGGGGGGTTPVDGLLHWDGTAYVPYQPGDYLESDPDLKLLHTNNQSTANINSILTVNGGLIAGSSSESNAITGVFGISPGGFGVAGQSSKSTGVYGTSEEGIGVEGNSTLSIGVHGSSFTGVAGSFTVSEASTGNILQCDVNGIIKSSIDFNGTASSIHLNGGNAQFSGLTSEAGAALGGGGNVNDVQGNDIAGMINVSTGSNPSANGTIAIITFNVPYTTPPFIVFSAGNYDAATNIAKVYMEASPTQLFIRSAAALPANQTYVWYFHAIQ